MIVARVHPRDDSWFILASNALGVPESVLRDYATHGDNLSLAVLIHVTRQQFSHVQQPWLQYCFSDVLEAASTFNVQDSSPKLQHEFCALWNQIVLKTQKDNSQAMAWYILGPIRNVYLALHQDTDSAPTRFSPSTGGRNKNPFSYPMCHVVGHTHGDSPSTSLVRAAALAPASLASSDAHSSPVPASLHVDESLTGVPLLENLHCAHQATTHSLRNSITSLDTATTSVIRDIVSSGITMLTPPTSTSALLSPTPPPAVIPLQRDSDPLTPSDPPNLSYPASPKPVLVNIVPTDPPLSSLSSHSPIARSNLSPSCLEPHHSITITTTPSASNGPISAKGDDSLKFSSRKEKDCLGPPSVNWEMHANTVAVLLDFPPQLPSGTDPDVATARRSLRGLNPERAGDHPLHPSHCPYDMV
ncbi:hypothetical protein EDB84DRAFT_1525609 [Lactarius hengduanensis]|nr:hypothetical protein EDB84DRAFT_1525609 [Lactarius hengduanensis]